MHFSYLQEMSLDELHTDILKLVVNHFDALTRFLCRFVNKRFCSLISPVKIRPSIAYVATIRGNIGVLKFLHGKPEYTNPRYDYELERDAARCGQLDLLQYLYQVETNWYHHSIYRLSQEYPHKHVTSWLASLPYPQKHLTNGRILLMSDLKVKVTGRIGSSDIHNLLLQVKDAPCRDKYDRRVFNKHIKMYSDILEHADLVDMYLSQIQDAMGTRQTLLIETESGLHRFIIYKLCEILGLKFKRMEEHRKKEFACCNFARGDSSCGCAYVPKFIAKHETDLDYDDQTMLFEVPWCYKTGVRIFLTTDKRD